MRDKPYILLILCVIFSLGACSGDTAGADLPAQEICVYGAAESYSLSRGAPTALPASYNMWVATVYHDPGSATHEYFFDGPSGNIALGFAYDYNTGTWKVPGQTYLYPFDGTMDFLAFATLDASHKPTATFSPATLTSSSPTFSSLSLDFGTSLDGTDDVLYSDRASANCTGIGAADVPVLNFRHAMSKVIFTMRTFDATTANRCQVSAITLNSVNRSGVLTVTPGVASTAAWSSVTSNGSVNMPDISTPVKPSYVTADTDLGAQVGSQIYLPTQLGATKVSVSITYSMINGATDITTPGTTRTISVDLPVGNWLPGVQYTYTLTVGLTGISMECADLGVIIDTQVEEINKDEIYQGTTPVNI